MSPAKPLGAVGLLSLAWVLRGASGLQSVSLVDFCGQTLRGDGVVLTSHPESRRFYFVAADTDCQLAMQAASPQDKVLFQFRFFLVYSLPRRPTDLSAGAAGSGHHSPRPQGVPETAEPCASGSYMQFYDGQDATAKPLGMPLCGTHIPRPVLSSGNFLTLRLVTRDRQPRVDFVGDFTSLRVGLNASACRRAAYFPCRNGNCIPTSLVCDRSNVDNCGDGTDQSARPPAQCRESSAAPLPLLAEASSAVSVRPNRVTCVGLRGRLLSTTSPSAWDAADAYRPALALLGAVSGAALLSCCCCCSPGWLVWRAGACRNLPGCNAACAACHLCTHSCARRRSPKVAPRGSPGPPV